VEAECTGSRYKSGETHWIRCSKHSQNMYFCSNKKNSRLTTLVSQVITKITGKASQIVDETNTVNTFQCGSEVLLGYRRELEVLESMLHPSYTIKAAIADLKVKISTEETKGEQSEKFDAQKLEKLYAFSQAAFWESLEEDKLCLAFRFFVDSVLVDSTGNVNEIKFLL
jgi:site-specific DNA recombinase